MELELKIDEIQAADLTDEIFRNNYFIPQKPLLIKGLSRLYPAGRKWSLDYFRELAGEEEVELFDNRVEGHKMTTMISPDLKMKLGDFLNLISKDEYTPLRMFVFNFFKLRPQLKNDFPCPSFMSGYLDEMGYFFMGGKNTEVRIHYDVDCSNVLLTQFYGRKEVVLIAPEYTELLYRLPFTTQTNLDVNHPDYTKYPGLKHVKGYKFIQEAGDAVFMPARWWHYMTYLEGGIAVSYRKFNRNPLRNLQGFASLGIAVPFDKMMTALFKGAWSNLKKNMAIRRANRTMQSMHIQAN
ncbi:MAG TPA: cupin-like domain-containing protein [Bacteroidia bacterium]|nr:cupin-like domain-containing protein [Bacteroidia bacterium]